MNMTYSFLPRAVYLRNSISRMTLLFCETQLMLYDEEEEEQQQQKNNDLS